MERCQKLPDIEDRFFTLYFTGVWIDIEYRLSAVRAAGEDLQRILILDRNGQETHDCGPLLLFDLLQYLVEAKLCCRRYRRIGTGCGVDQPNDFLADSRQ